MALRPNNHHKKEQPKIFWWEAEDRKRKFSTEAGYQKGLQLSGSPGKKIEINRLRIQIFWVWGKDGA